MRTVQEEGSEADGEMERIQLLRSRVEAGDPGSAGNLDDATLRRFLRARNQKIDKACKFLLQDLQWRRSFLSQGRVYESEIPNELKKKKIFLQGVDKMQRPIGVILAARHDGFDRDLEEFKRFVVYGFDKAVASISGSPDKFVLIADLKGWGYRNMDIKGYLAILDILQDHYPERLGKFFLVHVPYLFWGAWKLVYPFIDPVVKEKIVFVEDKNLQDVLLKDIDVSQLPDLYGGRLTLVPIQDVGLN